MADHLCGKEWNPRKSELWLCFGSRCPLASSPKTFPLMPPSGNRQNVSDCTLHSQHYMWPQSLYDQWWPLMALKHTSSWNATAVTEPSCWIKSLTISSGFPCLTISVLHKSIWIHINHITSVGGQKVHSVCNEVPTCPVSSVWPSGLSHCPGGSVNGTAQS